jgi:hypothetical protein
MLRPRRNSKNPIIMNAKAFFDLVVKMREAQKKYFKTRNIDDLHRAKKLEWQIDSEIFRVTKIVSGEKSLFDNP